MAPRVILGAAPKCPPPQCHFWKLPLELRFAIYDFAYGRGKTITPQECSVLPQLGRSKVLEQNSDTNDRRKRESVIGKRLVSKQFLAETMQHLAERNIFCIKWKNGGLALVSTGFIQHIRSLTVEWNYHTFRGKMDLMTICPRLRSLQLLVDDKSLRLAGGTGITDMGLRSSLIVIALSLVRGLESFSLMYNSAVIGDCEELWHDEAGTEAMYAMARLEGILHSMVTGSGSEDAMDHKASKISQEWREVLKFGSSRGGI